MAEPAQVEKMATAQGGPDSEEAGPIPDHRWKAWPAIVLERVRLPYAAAVVLLGLFTLGEQVLEYSIERAAAGGPLPVSPVRLLVSPLLVIYILVYIRLTKTAALAELVKLRPAVQVTDKEYRDHVRRLIAADPRVELALLAASLATVLALFVGMRAPLLNSDRGLPHSLPAAAYVLAAYTALGWLLLMIVYTSLREARALHGLARRPLVVNPFELKNLLPFGHLSLIQSLPLVGLVLVPLVLLGAPQGAGYVVIGLSVMSLLALLVPLWGVHQQIRRAKEKAQLGINARLHEVEQVLVERQVTVGAADLASLSAAVATLASLRKLIEESPNWPFRDSASLARAVAAATSPLAYFVLNEVIRVYLLPLLTRAP